MENKNPTIICICFEGCHGSGKTVLCNELKGCGFKVFDECFLDMPKFDGLHPQSLTMETIWVSRWMERILNKQKELSNRSEECSIIFADRSPYTSVFYANKGHYLETIIKTQIEELKETAGIYIYNVYLKVSKQVLWSRINARLEKEPERKKYNEHEIEWMNKVVGFYEENSAMWDMTIDNNKEGIELFASELISKLLMKEPFKNHLSLPNEYKTK